MDTALTTLKSLSVMVIGAGRFSDQHRGAVVFFDDGIQFFTLVVDLICRHLILGLYQDQLPVALFQLFIRRNMDLK